MKNCIAMSHARLRPCRSPAGKEEGIGIVEGGFDGEHGHGPRRETI